MALVSDLSDLSDKMGAPVFALTGYAVASHGITPGGCCAAVWYGSGQNVPVGYAGQRDGNGGVLSAGVWHNKTVTNGG